MPPWGLIAHCFPFLVRKARLARSAECRDRGNPLAPIIAGRQGIPVRQLVIGIDADRDNSNLSSAIRLFVREHYRRLAGLAAKGKR